jgi:hypothetical protein
MAIRLGKLCGNGLGLWKAERRMACKIERIPTRRVVNGQGATAKRVPATQSVWTMAPAIHPHWFRPMECGNARLIACPTMKAA